MPADSATRAAISVSASSVCASKSNTQSPHTTTSHGASHSNCTENSNTHRSSDDPESAHQHSSAPTSNSGSIASVTAASGQSNSNSKSEKVPLRECGEWGEYMSSSGRIYYYNSRSEKSQWQRPESWTLGAHPSQSKSSAPKTSSSTANNNGVGVPSTTAENSRTTESSPQLRRVTDERTSKPHSSGDANERVRGSEADSKSPARQSSSASGDRERERERERERRGASDRTIENRPSSSSKGSHTSTPNKSLDGGRLESQKQESQRHLSHKQHESVEVDASVQKRSRLSVDAHSDEDRSGKRDESERGAPAQSWSKARRSTSPERERSSRPRKRSSERERERESVDRSARQADAGEAPQSCKSNLRTSGDMDISPASPSRTASPVIAGAAARALYVHNSSRSQSSTRARHSEAPQNSSSRPDDMRGNSSSARRLDSDQQKNASGSHTVTSLVAALTSGGGHNAIGQQSPMTPFIGQAGPSPGGPNNAVPSTTTVPRQFLNEKLALVMREVSASLARQSQHQSSNTPSPGAGGHSANAAGLTPSTTPSSGGATNSSNASSSGAPLPNPAASIINAVINQFISNQQHPVPSVPSVTPTMLPAVSLLQHQSFSADAAVVPKSVAPPALLSQSSECLPHVTPLQPEYSPAVQVQQQTPAFLLPEISGLIDANLLASIQIPESDNYFRQADNWRSGVVAACERSTGEDSVEIRRLQSLGRVAQIRVAHIEQRRALAQQHSGQLARTLGFDYFFESSNARR